MSAVDVWNAIGTWVGGLGSLSAAAAAVWIAIRDGRERDAARRDDEAAQARTLIIETTWETGDGVAVIRVSTHGTLSFLAVHLERIVISPGDAPPGSRQTIKNGGRPVLPPGDSYNVLVSVQTPQGRFLAFEEPYLVSGVVAYRDAFGRAWRRWGNTDPQRIVNASDTKRPIPDQGPKIVEVEG